MKPETKNEILNALEKGISEGTQSEIDMLKDLRFEFEHFFSTQEIIKGNNKLVNDFFAEIAECFNPNKK